MGKWIIYVFFVCLGLEGMGWLRSVGSMKLQVSFAEYCLFYRALLPEWTIVLSILLSKAIPYSRSGTDLTHVSCCTHERVNHPFERVTSHLRPWKQWKRANGKTIQSVRCTKNSRRGSNNATRTMTWISILVSHAHTRTYT